MLKYLFDKLKFFLAGAVTCFICIAVYYYYYAEKNFISRTELVNYLSQHTTYNALPVSMPIENNQVLSSEQTNSQITASRENAITLAVKQVTPGVVGINVLKLKSEFMQSPLFDDYFSQFFGPSYRNRNVKSVGSGVVYTSDGYILTNEHVIHNAQEIIVTTTEGNKYPAKLIGADEKSDIAILKIEVNQHPHIRLGNSDQIINGEWVIAFGNPYGLFEYNNQPLVSVGVISGTGINFGRSQNKLHFYENMIQTDAAINPGNSGGPLVNAAGEVIGINTMIYSENGGSIGIGFATPINKVREITKILQKEGWVNRNINLGFSIVNLNDNIAKAFQITKQDGVLITQIESNGAAAKAGFKVGDLIIGVENVKIDNFKDIKAALFDAKDYKVGDMVKLTIIRDNQLRKISMKLVSY